jgi:hypothetical protein
MSDEAAHSATDPDLWVEVAGHDGKLFIMGNPHTFPGRITGWSYEGNHSLYFSKAEVTAASDAARWWIDGFLHGNEPSLAEYLGIDPGQAERLEDDDPGVARWRDAVGAFRSSGDIHLLGLRPTKAFPVESVNGHMPWMWAGGEIWIWRTGAWAVDPHHWQPLGSEVLGSPCIADTHELEDVGEDYIACINCGNAIEVEPSDA